MSASSKYKLWYVVKQLEFKWFFIRNSQKKKIPSFFKSWNLKRGNEMIFFFSKYKQDLVHKCQPNWSYTVENEIIKVEINVRFCSTKNEYLYKKFAKSLLEIKQVVITSQRFMNCRICFLSVSGYSQTHNYLRLHTNTFIHLDYYYWFKGRKACSSSAFNDLMVL